MRDFEIIELIQRSTALPPTLAAELVRALPKLPPEKVEWIISILQMGQTADTRYNEAVARMEEVLRANKLLVDQEVIAVSEPVLDNIMAEFEEELDLLMK
jgi:hypothetical protein